MKKFFVTVRVLGAVTLLLQGTSQAQFIVPGLTGTTTYDGWADLTSANYPTITHGGSFPGASPWVSPIAANQPGSNGGGLFNKISGNGFTSGTSVYSPFTQSQYSVFSNTSVANVDTVVFQLEIGSGESDDIVGNPVLRLNGTTDFAPLYMTTVSSVFLGTFNFGTGDFDAYKSVFAYQWDLSSFVSPITSIEVQYTVGSHAQIYGMREDRSDIFTQVVPEPATYGLMFLGCSVLLFGRRLRRRTE